ncbi:MAG: hypothetical protein ACOH1P_00795 [Lysobacter sp.]
MNREINNTLHALVASSALLVAVLVLASPATPAASHIGQGAAQASGMDTDAMLADAAEHATPASDSDFTPTDSTSTRSTGTSSRWHHSSVAMPYFSFVPRG